MINKIFHKKRHGLHSMVLPIYKIGNERKSIPPPKMTNPCLNSLKQKDFI